MEIDEMALGQEEANPDASEPEGTTQQPVAEAQAVEEPESNALAIEGTDEQVGGEEMPVPQAEDITEAADADTASPDESPEPAEAPVPVDDEEVPIEQAPSEASTTDEVHPMEALLESDFSLQTLKRGEILEGTIVRASRSEILIDVGGKTEGVIPSRELERMDEETLNSLEVGSSVMAYILTPEDRSGNILLSLARAREESDWIEAEQHMSKDEAYEGTISGFNKGGLIVRYGQLRGFVPASQVSVERRRSSTGATPEERWGDMLHESIVVKVVEVDRTRNRLILSERAASKESRAARKSALLENLDVGQVATGRVISLTDFGAFVDLGGADGLVHLSELSWGHVTHPKEVLSIGDEVEVEIISLDRERQRIGLSYKRRQDDPWTTMISRYEVGQLVQGTVTKLTKFGAFARLVQEPEIEGLIHISELADRRVGHPRDVVEEGQVLTLRIVRIEPDKRRIGLSLKRVESEAYLDTDWRTMTDDAEDEVEAAETEAEVEMIEAEDAAEADEAEDVVEEAETEAEVEVIEAEDAAEVDEAEDEVEAAETVAEVEMIEAEDVAEADEAEDEVEAAETEAEVEVIEAEDAAEVDEAEDVAEAPAAEEVAEEPQAEVSDEPIAADDDADIQEEETA
jgi:small subunit ribosomal protein S1